MHMLWLGLIGCGGGGSAADTLDARYMQVMFDVGSADRDTTRNVHNKEARRRKAAAETARIAFFQDPEIQKKIAAAADAPADSIEHVKGQSYKRAQLVVAPWTKEEKAEEIRLLGVLDEAASTDASWSAQDGTVTIKLGRNWSEVSKEADKLDDAARQSLAETWVNHRTGAFGADLQALVTLRNTVAKRAGYPTYWELALAGQGLTPADVDAIVGELTPVVTPIHAAINAKITAAAADTSDTFANHPLLRRRAGLDVGGDEADAWFDGDQAEDRILTSLQAMGVTTSGWQVYTGPTRYVRPGVYGFSIIPPEHLAVVMSVDERYSTWPYEALAHETGHLVWWRFLSAESAASPALWEPTAPWFEGFAQFFERVVFEPTFAEKYMPEFPVADREMLRAWRARDAAESISDAIVETRTEQKLYADPSDLGAICAFAAGLRHEIQGGPEAPKATNGIVYDASLWSSLLWNDPAYSQNYLYAYSTEAWMWEGVTKQVGDPVGNPKVGPFVRDHIVQVPAGTPFPDRLAALTPTTRADALAAYLAIGAPPAP